MFAEAVAGDPQVQQPRGPDADGLKPFSLIAVAFARRHRMFAEAVAGDAHVQEACGPVLLT